MSRSIIHYISALNIVTHPHSTAGYVRHFKSAFKAQKPVNLRGDAFGFVASCVEFDPKNPESALEGELFKFVDLDLENWFNIKRAEEASSEELAQIKIPVNLCPDLQRFRYVFFPDKHRFIFETKRGRNSLSPRAASRLVDGFLNSSEMALQGCPHADITVEQSKEQLAAILDMYDLRRLTIFLKRPNADEGDEGEKAILREMSDQNIQSSTTDLVAENGRSLDPNKRTQIMAHVAISNGNVSGSGKDESGKVIKEDTSDHPIIKAFSRPPQSPVVLWFRDIADKVLRLL